jgi:hypothetical protein
MHTQNDAATRHAEVCRRATDIIETLLQEMAYLISHPDRLSAPDYPWEQVFGAKQPLVTSLKTLVQALAELRPPMAKLAEKNKSPEATISPQELAQFYDWVRTQSPNASDAAATARLPNP